MNEEDRAYRVCKICQNRKKITEYTRRGVGHRKICKKCVECEKCKMSNSQVIEQKWQGFLREQEEKFEREKGDLRGYIETTLINQREEIENKYRVQIDENDKKWREILREQEEKFEREKVDLRGYIETTEKIKITPQVSPAVIRKQSPCFSMLSGSQGSEGTNDELSHRIKILGNAIRELKKKTSRTEKQEQSLVIKEEEIARLKIERSCRNAQNNVARFTTSENSSIV